MFSQPEPSMRQKGLLWQGGMPQCGKEPYARDIEQGRPGHRKALSPVRLKHKQAHHIPCRRVGGRSLALTHLPMQVTVGRGTGYFGRRL